MVLGRVQGLSSNAFWRVRQHPLKVVPEPLLPERQDLKVGVEHIVNLDENVFRGLLHKMFRLNGIFRLL